MLVYCGKSLQPETALCEYSIKGGSCINVIVKEATVQDNGKCQGEVVSKCQGRFMSFVVMRKRTEHFPISPDCSNDFCCTMYVLLHSYNCEEIKRSLSV